MKYAIEDSDVLAAVAAWNGKAMTYVIRNRLAANGRPHLKTAQVLRQLKRMEIGGKVQRVPSVYTVQICWATAKRTSET